MRRFLIVAALLSVGLVAVYGVGLTFFLHGLASADSYPTFMTDYQHAGPRSYEEARHSFFDFVVKTFPIGSDAKYAIAQITRGGFQITRSDSDAVEMIWKRHAGPCTELYSIVISRDVDGMIAKGIGRLQPICL
jgi:hypothetical protein